MLDFYYISKFRAPMYHWCLQSIISINMIMYLYLCFYVFVFLYLYLCLFSSKILLSIDHLHSKRFHHRHRCLPARRRKEEVAASCHLPAASCHHIYPKVSSFQRICSFSSYLCIIKHWASWLFLFPFFHRGDSQRFCKHGTTSLVHSRT